MNTYALVAIRPEDTLDLAAQMMTWADIVHLPVVTASGKVVGVITARDLLGNHDRRAPVQDFMASPPVTVSPDEDMALAAMTMAARRIGCLPVVEDDVLVGILTTGDILAQQVSGTLHHGPEPSPTIRALLGAEVATAHAGDALLDAVARMRSRGVRHLPVVDGEGRLIGMLSDRDVRAAVSTARAPLLSVGDAMSRRPVSAPVDATLLEIARLLTEKRIGAVVVVDDEERVVGILSYVDVLRAAAAATQQPKEIR